MSEQLSLLEWKALASIVPFPLHRSHGATAGVAKEIMHLDTAKRTGRMNSLRAQTRKRLAPIIGQEMADDLADDLLRMVRIQISYRQICPTSHKKNESSAVIFSLAEKRIQTVPHGEGAGAAGAPVPRAVPLAGVGGAHEEDRSEYDAARTREGAAA